MVAPYPRTAVNWRQYGLSPAQAWQAEQRLVLANQRRPLSGPKATYSAGLRISGILRAVRAGWIGNRRWGRQLHGHRGGHAVKRYRARYLQTLPRLGAEAQQVQRDSHRKQQEYDQRPVDAAPPLRSTRPWEDQGPGVVWNLDDLD